MRRTFDAYHSDNPHVFTQLAGLALSVYAAGRRRLSINALFERLRWETMLSTTGDDYKLNNSYRADYARMLMREYPQLAGFFETRTLKAPRQGDMLANAEAAAG
jgi:hypothetical protein